MPGKTRSRRDVLGRIRALVALATGASIVSDWSSPQAAPLSGRPWTPLFPQPDAVIVSGILMGKPVRVLIDTGSAVTVVDKSFAHQVGLKPDRLRSVRGDIGSVTLGAGEKLQLKVGAAKAVISSYLVTDFTEIFGADPGGPNVILGVDALADGVVEIDFPGRRLALWPRATFQPTGDADRFTVLRTARGQLTIPTSVEGSAPVTSAVDLGSSNPLTVSPDLADALGMLKDRRVSSAATGGIDGISISRTVSVTTLQIGGLLLRDIPCEVLAKTDSSLAPMKLGLPVFERYRFALDVVGRNLWLQSTPRLAAAPFTRDLSGLGLVIEPGKLRVVHVAAGSPAAEAGWREGEEIIAVDGEPIGTDYGTRHVARWRDGPEGKTIRLSMVDRSQRTLILKRYY